MASQSNHERRRVPRPSADRRQNERYATIYRVARVVTERGQQLLCLIRNISSGGLMLETHSRLVEGERLRIEPKTGEHLTGVISWAQPHLAGVSFEEPLDVEEFLSPDEHDGGAPMPRAPRIEARCEARLQVGPIWQKVTLRDLSLGGAKIECDTPMSVGEKIVLQVEGLIPMPGHVRWTRENQFGLKFSSALPFGELSRWTDRRDGGDSGWDDD